MKIAKQPLQLPRIFRALADDTRLRLFNLIHEDEICVCYLVATLGLSQPKISRHLAYLRRAGLVATRREGKWMHYQITAPANKEARRVFTALRSWLQADVRLQEDRRRLASICCSARKPALVKGAPTPRRFR